MGTQAAKTNKQKNLKLNGRPVKVMEENFLKNYKIQAKKF